MPKLHTPKLTGGKKGWSAAIDDAYYGIGLAMHSPQIRYSHERGFFVQPQSVPMGNTVLWWEPCAYHADTGQKFQRYSDYGRVRRDILGDPSYPSLL